MSYDATLSLNSIFLLPKYRRELDEYYKRADFFGNIARHILDAPNTFHAFEKSSGISKLVESRVGPRINLRWTASYRTLSIVAASLIIGRLLFGRSIHGFFLLILIKFLTIFIASTYDLLSTH